MSTEIPNGRNLCMFLGQVSETPTSKDAKGLLVVEFLLGVRESWTTKQGETKESISHIPCVVFGPRGKVIVDFVKAGEMLHVSGALQVDPDDGTCSVKVQEVTLLKGDRGGGERSDRGRGGSNSNLRTRDVEF